MNESSANPSPEISHQRGGGAYPPIPRRPFPSTHLVRTYYFRILSTQPCDATYFFASVATGAYLAHLSVPRSHGSGLISTWPGSIGSSHSRHVAAWEHSSARHLRRVSMLTPLSSWMSATTPGTPCAKGTRPDPRCSVHRPPVAGTYPSTNAHSSGRPARRMAAWQRWLDHRRACSPAPSDGHGENQSVDVDL